MQASPCEAQMTCAMTTKARRAPAGAGQQFPLRCKGGKQQAQSLEELAKGFHFGATRPRPPGRQGGGHHGAQDGVTTRAFGRLRLLLSG